LTNAPALTLMEELIPGVLAPSLISLAVTVRVPVLFNVILKVRLPAASAALDGKVALPSLDVMPTVSVTVLTRFQLASTALTATLKAAPAVCAEGAPVLPVGVPGAVVSPGASN